MLNAVTDHYIRSSLLSLIWGWLFAIDNVFHLIAVPRYESYNKLIIHKVVNILCLVCEIKKKE